MKNESKLQKQRELHSQLTGPAYLKHTPQKRDVLDIDLEGLPTNTDSFMLRKLAGVKHLYHEEISHDKITGVCLGSGRIKIRLGDKTTEKEIVETLKKNGIKAFVHSPQKKLANPEFTSHAAHRTPLIDRAKY